ncbi:MULTISPECIES: fumarylacetoacetate hydrolase family protein [unclassified Streptomyces]|uniref:fumarylacetoacetate hydrolase family protein n=1 Tax=unclassified Streptomyces TaxID=2593676 RepID=UPI00225B9642|nr:MULTISPECIES: fumarylacetoacetate hydrolase family protein [unclassified Streptomyces]MCX4409951.1 fumarylacetoacetate hydrolase family protein [Streptomyces sp. NBC_01764]MCX5191721.1 fumarylacetoacetate hydrolase family protein [Streptomyces sp. NBC_00268]
MRIVGVEYDGEVHVANLSPDGAGVTVVAGLREFWDDPEGCLARPPADGTLPVGEAHLVPPVLPEAQVLCAGLNYIEHAAEGSYRDQELPEHPTLFARWTRSLTVGGADIPVPSAEDGLDWEGEIVAWVGRTLVDADPGEALAAVVGYSTFNDVTARRAQKLTSQWTLGKNADGSGPLGPMVPTAEVGDLRDGLRVRTRVNGVTVQDGSTSDMVHHVGETLAHVSRTLTLHPGDLLATGTPAGVGYARTPPWLLRPGDVVEVEVERLGVLRNTVVGNEHRQSPRSRSAERVVGRAN